MRREGSDQPERPGGMQARTAEEAADSKRAELESLRGLEKARQARVAKAVVAIGIAAILLIFIVSNAQGVKVHYVFFTRNPPLIWVMFACALLGGILGYLVGRPGKQVRIRRRQKDEKEKKK